VDGGTRSGVDGVGEPQKLLGREAGELKRVLQVFEGRATDGCLSLGMSHILRT
jgi:hypothetical protein